jgi:hypothetical protein
MKAVAERNGRAVLNRPMVKAIRRTYERENISLRALGHIVGVSHTTIRRIVCRITWKSVR